MASTQHPTTMENLPDDVLSNIFIRLLAKQIAQMRCASKSLNALLSESSFVKSQLHRSIHNKDEILLVFREECFSFHCEPFTAHSSQFPHLQLPNFIKIPFNPKPQNTVIGSVNGLVCLSHRSAGYNSFSIWNPSLSAMLNLPPHSMHSHNYNDSIELFRFGFEPETNDYKVVKLTGIYRPHTGPFKRHIVKDWLPVEVYSMRKGSWELITQSFPSYVTSIWHQHEVCVDGHNGHLHWLCYIDEKMEAQTIVAFDLRAEKFCEIPLPNSILDHSVRRGNYLGVLAGKICVMSCVRYGGECEVWVMDEYGMPESWVKRHVFSQTSGIIPVGFTLHNEFIFFQASCGRLSLYDPVAAKYKIINLISTLNGWIRIIDYVDSLVWIVPEISSSSISHIANLRRGTSRSVNDPRATKAKVHALMLLILYHGMKDVAAGLVSDISSG